MYFVPNNLTIHLVLSWRALSMVILVEIVPIDTAISICLMYCLDKYTFIYLDQLTHKTDLTSAIEII